MRKVRARSDSLRKRWSEEQHLLHGRPVRCFCLVLAQQATEKPVHGPFFAEAPKYFGELRAMV